MGKALAEAFPAAREVFDRVDAALGQNLSRLMFEGPEAELTLTANAQPALMAASMAALRALETEAGLRRGARRGLRRRPLARRIFGSVRRGVADARGYGAPAAPARRRDAEGGPGRRGRDGGAARARFRRGGEDRDRGRERRSISRARSARRRTTTAAVRSSFREPGPRSSGRWNSPSSPARSAPCCFPSAPLSIAR